MRTSPLAITTLLAALVLACSSDEKKTLSADDYDQTCSANSDCVIVDIGACECSCAHAAINVKDKPKFEHDLAQCDTGGNSCGMCPWMGDTVAVCTAGHCDTKLVSSDGG
ncbi:MAG: hypothetical protein IPM35_23305 [Myxococcales bacterium]|nr:hypothetical protein [Myxococcales bacterium]